MKKEIPSSRFHQSLILENENQRNQITMTNQIHFVRQTAANFTLILIKAGILVLEQLYKPGYVYKKIGILLFGLIPENGVQKDLFCGDLNPEVHRRLIHSVDTINQRWGIGTLLFAASGMCKSWQMKRRYLSKRYTTSWDELLIVRAC